LENNQKVKIAILISGRGSNMQALVNACENADFPAQVVLVLSNKADAAGLEFAKSKGIKIAFVSHKDFTLEENPRQAFDKKVSEEVEKSAAQIICLAGFMRLLSGWFVEKWFDHLINIHPSLLPEFKGADAVGDAIKAGAKISGCTVHFVREEMDSGPIIKQAQVEVSQDDTKESLAAKILKKEHEIYPQALKEVCQKIQK
jgi:phosphoribosylglycinamide formyltransferase 1